MRVLDGIREEIRFALSRHEDREESAGPTFGEPRPAYWDSEAWRRYYAPPPRFAWAWKWEPRDLWIGAYWTHRFVSVMEGLVYPRCVTARREFHVYVCLLPTLVLHLVWQRKSGVA